MSKDMEIKEVGIQNVMRITELDGNTVEKVMVGKSANGEGTIVVVRTKEGASLVVEADAQGIEVGVGFSTKPENATLMGAHPTTQ